MLFRDNRDFLKKIWISHTFCPFWSQFWTTKCKQKGLGTKISIKIFVKIHYFLVEIEKKIEKSTKITYNHKNLDKSWQVSISLDLDQKVQSWLSSSRLNWDFSISIEKSKFSRLIFWNCQDFLDRQDWPFFGVKIENLDWDPQGSKEHKFLDVNALAVNIIIILLLDSSKVIQDEGTQVFGCKCSRCKRYQIFKISWHYQDFFKTLSRLQAQKSQQIEKSRARNVITLTNSWSRLRQTVEFCQKCHVSRLNGAFSISIEISRSSRLTFWNC
jgi:hypothetical protein